MMVLSGEGDTISTINVDKSGQHGGMISLVIWLYITV